MTRTIGVVGALCLAQALIAVSAFAQASPGASSRWRGNFEPKAADGLPIVRPDTCGEVSKAKDSLIRDLGQGISLLLIPSHGEGDTVAANFLFTYHWKKESLRLLPERFELQVHPGGMTSTPQKVVRRSSDIDGHETFQEEVYVEFVVPRDFESLSFSFPANTVGSVPEQGGPLVVRPFFFGVTERPSSPRAAGGRPGCMYSPVNIGRLVWGR